jgi:hypothetical protein
VRRPKSRVRNPAKAVYRPHLNRPGIALRFMKNEFRVADDASKIGPVCFKNAILPPPWRGFEREFPGHFIGDFPKREGP